MTNDDLLQVIQKAGLLDESGITKLKREVLLSGRTAEAIISNQRLISDAKIGELKSGILKIPYKQVDPEAIGPDLLAIIPEETARTYNVVPIEKRDNLLVVGMVHPDDSKAQEAVKFIARRDRLSLGVYVISYTDWQDVLRKYSPYRTGVEAAVQSLNLKSGEGGRKIVRLEEGALEEAPIITIVANTLREAVFEKASDVHIEPQEHYLRIRFRIDGDLKEAASLPLELSQPVVSRVKVMSSLKIDETRIPQDGRFHLDMDGRGIDFRISTLPTSFGEKVVIRILDPDAGIKTLEDLGFLGGNLDRIVEGIKRPYGMILITGPTGSGKSTTLYGLLQILNKEETNIISLEDPIEYFVEGVNQSQIRPEIGYDFASGLRHILRQDPDIILVGEIRDKETAQLAVHAALTGHLVLTTLHTNGAIGVIPRLIDMGIDPFLIAPTVVLAVGQRLVRRLCPDSRKKTSIEGRAKEIIMPDIEQMPAALREKFAANPPREIYEPEVSPTCPKGTRGRVGINEVLVMTPELEKIILTHPSEADISAEAKRQGMITMRQDGILKVLDGAIGLEELLETV